MMHHRIFLGIGLFIVILLMIVNPKINIKAVLTDTMKIYRNNKSSICKLYWLDVVTFFVCPIVFAGIITIGFEFAFSVDVANTLITVFAILFTLLFGIMSLLTATIENTEGKKQKISKEAFTSITFVMILSLLAIVGLIIYICGWDYFVQIKWCTNILTLFEIALSVSILLHFLMVIKRTYLSSI